MNHHTDDPVCPLCEEKLLTAHADLYDWYHTYVKPIYPGAHISWAWRGQADQDAAVASGKSELTWPHSKHNHMKGGKPCSLALDLFEDVGGVAEWPHAFFSEINDQNEIAERPIAWGGLFKDLGDSDHFELLLDID